MLSRISCRRLRTRGALLVLAATGAGAVAAFPSWAAESRSGLRPEALQRAKVIRAESNARYRGVPGRRLVVTEASSLGVIESFTLMSARMDEVRIVPADGIWYAICPARATCPYPAPRLARPAGHYLPRRLALELAVRTFLETSASVVAVSLPSPRFTFLVVERNELADLPALAKALRATPARPAAVSLLRVVDELTRPRIFVPIGIEPTPTGRTTLAAYPLWPSNP